MSRAIYEAADGNRAAGAKLVVAGQPTSRATWFFDACERLGFHTIRIASTDSPNVKLGRKVVPGLADSGWIEEKRLDWGGEDDPRFQIEVLGIFPTREALRLVSDEEARGLLRAPRGYAGPQSSDRAALLRDRRPRRRRGGDKSAIVARRGAVVLEMLAFNGATDSIMGELDVLARKHRKWATEPYHVNFDGSSTWGADLAVATARRVEPQRRRDDVDRTGR